MPKKLRLIPTYAADGKRLRSYSLEAIEHLLQLSFVVVVRDRRGRIASANFRPHSGANPLRLSCHMGQRYSYREHVGAHRAWTHKSLPQRPVIDEQSEDPVLVDLYIRAIFRAVPLSCLRPPEPPPARPARARAKVIPIDCYRQQQPVRRAA